MTMDQGGCCGPGGGHGSVEVEEAVRARYSAASQTAEPSLCCPINYDTQYLRVLPAELIERDYGCGDPSRHVQAGEAVLDLGSGGGKICYIASQIVGPEGRVIGVDMNRDMLALARKYQPQISEAIGWHNVTFHRGKIQDLALDLEAFDEYLNDRPVQTADDWLAAQSWAARQRQQSPMVASASVDVVISNCVLNLVRREDRRQMFQEISRVLRDGGRAVISDIVCDELVPEHLQQDSRLWSGCLSGAFLEHELLDTFAASGFYGIEILDYQDKPWAVIEGIEFRSVTVRAFKGKEGPCLERRQAVIYKGPWSTVTDDDGHTLRRGVRSAVCDKTYQILSRPPYVEQVQLVPPTVDVPLDQAKPFPCDQTPVRSPRETKQNLPRLTALPSDSCCGDNQCC
jgi:arsenite methyltransferase